MPEYLAPGVYVEETSFRAKSIEGVPTSTTGFAGMTRYGPVAYPDGPRTTEPLLVTSFPEFERAYGKLDLLGADRVPYLAHATRAFFLNGGQRLYVSRVFTPVSGTNLGVAQQTVPPGVVPPATPTATWRARWPGAMGNVHLEVRPVRSQNVAVANPVGSPVALTARRAHEGALVEKWNSTTDPLPQPTDPLDSGRLRIVREDLLGAQTFDVPGGGTDALGGGIDTLYLVELQVLVRVDAERVDQSVMLGCDPAHKRYIGKILQRDDPEDAQFVVWFDPGVTPPDAATLAVALTGTTAPAVGVFDLTGGNDGLVPTADDLLGHGPDPDDSSIKATGLSALADVDDIAIVAMPDAATLDDPDERTVATEYLIAHAEAPGAYRIAIVDGPEGSSLNEIRAFRGQFDTTYGALYYPWIEILDPTQRPEQGAPPPKIMLPPSGFVAGIYARTDIARGVWKAPANEVVQGLTRFEANVNTARQQVLNPEGVNALRFFAGRGSRVWGARTLTSDPEWKYVPVRRFFIFLEHSIDKATQWAVFEPNGETLWRKITRTVETFLEAQWRDGALMGTTTAQAYFVRCDRTTMTQNDLDNGKLICLIGVAPVRPAEFVIFRIGQWTADAQI
jgi:phage tail sheath protein FI